MMPTFQYATVRGLKMFYRETGSKKSPVMKLRSSEARKAPSGLR